jgi:hypothetical protein
MWHPDNLSKFNGINQTNHWFVARQARAVKRPISMIIPLHVDTAHQHKLLPSNTYRLIRRSSAFCLIGAAGHEFILLVKNALLSMYQVTVSAEVALVPERAVQKTPCVYPMQRTETISHVIPMGNRNETYVHSNNGQLPTEDIITFVYNEAFISKETKNSSTLNTRISQVCS